MAYVIDCVDGMQVRGETMDELRRNAEKHVAEYHQGEDLDLEAIMATAREESSVGDPWPIVLESANPA